MIISHSRKFVYLRTVKVASSSLEFYFAQFCKKNDLITPLFNNEEKIKKKYNIPTKQNYRYSKFSLSIKNIIKFKFTKYKRVHGHSTIDEIFKLKLFNYNLKDYYIFSFIRNPYDWFVSYFWWDLYHHKKKNILYINSLSKKKIKIKFKKFLVKECEDFFRINLKIITSKNVKINVFKLEELKKSISYINKKLFLKNIKINIFDVKLKNLNIKKKIRLDESDQKLILKAASYFFKKFNYSKKLPKKYIR